MKTLAELLDHIRDWPEPHKTNARELIRDAANDLSIWPYSGHGILLDVNKRVQAEEEEMEKLNRS